MKFANEKKGFERKYNSMTDEQIGAMGGPIKRASFWQIISTIVLANSSNRICILQSRGGPSRIFVGSGRARASYHALVFLRA
jgi:hypothetical protein